MTLHTELSILMAATYFVGAIPFGLLVAKANGVDPRTAGSKNIGASNVGRLLGRKFFWIVFALDAAKSLIPMLIASWLVSRVPQVDRSQLTYLLWIGVGAMAVVGHMLPVYLKFKGGKGVATACGMLLGLVPYFTLAAIAALIVYVVVLLSFRFISLGSMLSALSFPLFYVLIGRWMQWDVFGRQLPLLIVSSLLAVMIVIRHRTNIRRLLSGTENRIAFGSKP